MYQLMGCGFVVEGIDWDEADIGYLVESVFVGYSSAKVRHQNDFEGLGVGIDGWVEAVVGAGVVGFQGECYRQKVEGGDT